MLRGRRARGAGEPNHLVVMLLVLAAVGVLGVAGSRLESPEPVSPASPGGAGSELRGGTLTLAWGQAPESLDPAFATDRTSANLVLNLFDPLVRLGPSLELRPALAREWRISEDGRRVTFLLRRNARWSNGQPVRASDLEYAWKRALSPGLASPLAPRLFGIEGAAAYNACTVRCGAAAAGVGVRARDPYRLVVRLVAPQPWFLRAVAQPVFLPVHRPTVLDHGTDWTEPGRIVTNGPFVLGGMTEREISLVRNSRFRPGARASLARVEGRVIPDATARVQAFDAGSIQATDGSAFPKPDLPTLRERREYQVYPTLRSTLYAFNLTRISDVRQRRAMALAIDRTSLVENVTQAGEVPATRFLPAGTAPEGRPPPQSPWLPPGGDLAAARAELAAAAAFRPRITLLHLDGPGQRDVAVFLRAAWRQLGIETTLRARPAESFLDFRGPLGPRSVDLYQVDLDPWIPDAWPALALWTCRSDRNKTNFCNGGFDSLVERARAQGSAVRRAALHADAELVLSGESGTLPAIPVHWPTYTTLESLQVKETFAVNPLGQIDLSAVVLD